MRLFEIEMPLLYLHSGKVHAPGTLLRPENTNYPLGTTIEGLLEKGRPSGRLPRKASIFLKDRPDGSASYVYEVVPFGIVDRGSIGWLRLLVGDGERDQPLIDEWVVNYWAGNDCPTVPGEWEYRAERVRVGRLLGGYVNQ